MNPPDRFENAHVILGGGCCGLLLAHELAIRFVDDPRPHSTRSHSTRPHSTRPHSIWVIEAGHAAGSPTVSSRDEIVPARWLRLLGGGSDYQFQTQPVGELAGRSLSWPRGRGLGGSGRINAMIWFPPTRDDLAMLARAGGDGSAESVRVFQSRLQRGLDRAIQIVRPEMPHWISPTGQAFLEASRDHPELGRFHAYDRLNVQGRRWTAMHAIETLTRRHPAAAAKIHFARATAKSLSFEPGTRTRRVTRVHWSDGTSTTIGNDCHVVSCLGAIGSPALLHHSGMDDPAIGRNLHDHLVMPLIHAHDGSPMNDSVADTRSMAHWQHAGTGPLASNLAECGGLSPDGRFQLHVTPTDYLRFPNATKHASMSIGVNVTRPLSRGHLNFESGCPVIHAGYLNDEAGRDAANLVTGVRWVRDWIRRSGLVSRLGREMIPGIKRESDDAVLAAIKRYSQTLYHPGGTCPLGEVVRSDFRVRGVDNLSVVDASLLPEPTTGNPTATLAALTCAAAENVAQSIAQ